MKKKLIVKWKVFKDQSGYVWYETNIYTLVLDGCGENTVYGYSCNNKERNLFFRHRPFNHYTYSMVIFVSFSFPWIPNDVIKGHTDFLSIRPMTQKRLSWHIPKHYITIILFHILCISYIRYGRKALSLKNIILSF